MVSRPAFVLLFILLLLASYPDLSSGSGGTNANNALFATAAGDVIYVYDELGRLVAVIDPAGDTAVYSYDAVGNLLSISRHSSTTVAVIEFTPESGPVGTPVTIYGTGFSSTPNENTVTFNGVAATVSSSTVNRIVVSVPVSATTGPIAVTSPSVATINTSGKIGLMLFEGTAGRRVSLNMTNVSITNAGVSITTPGGSQLLASTFFNSSGKFIEPMNVLTNGTYQITVDPNNTYTGGATLTLYNVPPDFAATITPGGSSVTVPITAPGQNGQLSFAGTIGQRVSLA